MKNLIIENKKYVKAVIFKLTGEDNEDLEQEAYIKVWQNKDKYKDQGKFKQWICTVTANLCRDYFKSKSYQSDKHTVSNERVLENACVKSGAEERIDRKKRQKIILKAVDDLPKIYRDVIIYSEFEEYTIEEISLKLKIPQGTVKSRRHHALQILKQNLTFLLGENK